MSDKENKSPIIVKEEEIDLGKLFSLIGNAFSKLFKSIGTLLKGVFHYFILLLLFIREHIVKLGVAIILGMSIGFVMDYISSDKYSYDMIIQPNYNSIHQLFEKMEYYNVLVREGDSIALSKEFNISYDEANSLVSFALNPYETKKDQILAYNEFIENTDTLTQQYFTFSDFADEGTSQFDSKLYGYRVNSKNKNLPILNFKDRILFDVEINPTIQKKKEIKLRTLKLDSIASRNSLEQIDSLRSLYKTVTLLEVNKEVTPSSSTYLDFSKESKSNNNDLELFKISESLNQRLIKNEEDKENSIDVVNVITTFNSVGNNRGKLSESYMVLLAYIFGGAMLSWLLLIRLNAYLVKYKEQNTY